MRNILTKEILNSMANDYHNGVDLSELSETYGFQERTIKRHFSAIGINAKNGNNKKFSDIELENIIKDYQNGMRPFELSEKYKRRSGTIIGKLKEIGVYNNTKYYFTKDDIDFLRKYYPVGDWKSINERFPNIKKSSIHSKMSSLGIRMDEHFWTKEDEEILRVKYHTMYGKVKELVDLFDNKYTYHAITSKAEKIGLKTREYWNDAELEILKSRYEKCTLDEMMKYLPGRSRATIIVKAASFGLSSKIKIETRFSESEKQFIIDNYNNMTDKEIAKILKRSASAINNYRYRNGLVKIYEKSSYNDLSEYVRRNNLEWKAQSMKNCGYKCVLTGKRFDDIHHIYGLNLILNKTLEILNIEIRENMDDYTDKELKDILEVFRIKQSEYPLGVCLSKDVHTLFHNIYGYGDNTQKQWDEFVENFKEEKYSEKISVA